MDELILKELTKQLSKKNIIDKICEVLRKDGWSIETTARINCGYCGGGGVMDMYATRKKEEMIIEVRTKGGLHAVLEVVGPLLWYKKFYPNAKLYYYCYSDPSERELAFLNEYGINYHDWFKEEKEEKEEKIINKLNNMFTNCFSDDIKKKYS